jgi:hypothetical protein
MGKVESGWSFAFLRQFVGRLSRFSWVTCLFAVARLAAGAAIDPATKAETVRIEKRIAKIESWSWESLWRTQMRNQPTFLYSRIAGELTSTMLGHDIYAGLWYSCAWCGRCV